MESCVECGGTDLSWSLLARVSSTAVNTHCLSFNDVIPMLVLGCNTCSETLLVIENDSEVNSLISCRRATWDRSSTF